MRYTSISVEYKGNRGHRLHRRWKIEFYLHLAWQKRNCGKRICRYVVLHANTRINKIWGDILLSLKWSEIFPGYITSNLWSKIEDKFFDSFVVFQYFILIWNLLNIGSGILFLLLLIWILSTYTVILLIVLFFLLQILGKNDNQCLTCFLNKKNSHFN